MSEDLTQPIITESRKTPIIPILFTVLLVVLVSISGFLAYQNYQLQQKIVQNTTSSVPPTTAPTIILTSATDPTTDWKTYTNNQYSFSFRYPDKLEAQDLIGNAVFAARDPDFSGGVGSLVPLYLAVSVGDNLDKSPSENYIGELINTKTLTVSELTFKQKIYKGDYAEGSKVYGLIADTQRGSQDYVFEFSFATDGCLSPDQERSVCEEENKKFIDDNYKTIDQILSTFKFTEEEVSTDPETHKGWTTYTDKDAKFLIQYPQGWILRKTYGASVNNTGNYRVSGVDISTNLSMGSTVVVNIIDPKNETFENWVKLHSGEANVPNAVNSSYKNIPAYRFERFREGRPAEVVTYYALPNNLIVFLALNPSLADQAFGELILSSFKFTN